MDWIGSFSACSLRPRIVQTLIVVIGLMVNVSLSSCIHWQQGATPIYPEGSAYLSDPYVDSLSPTFKWENPLSTSEIASNIQDFSYEFRLSKCDQYQDDTYFNLGSGRALAGRNCVAMYEKTGLTEPSHRIEATLDPGTTYCWLVRATYKKGGTPHYSKWSTRGAFAMFVWNSGLCNWFRTPRQ